VLRVYDSNMPQSEQRLLIDTQANTWTYEGSANAEADPRPYVGNGENGNLLYFSPVTARLGRLTRRSRPRDHLTVARAT